MRIARIWMVVGSIAVTFAASTSRADDASQTDNSDAGDVALSTDGSEDAPPGDDGTDGEPPLDRPIGRPLTPRNPARSTRRAS